MGRLPARDQKETSSTPASSPAVSARSSLRMDWARTNQDRTFFVSTLSVAFQKAPAPAPAISEGNRNPEGLRTEERSPPGRGGFTPDAVPTRRKKKERE